MCTNKWCTLVARVLLGSLVALMVPAITHGQSAIAGQVTDESGGVLPGVTVEAASPALIEGSRVVATDAQGRYAIEALRPGTYKVTFTIQGFATHIRDGIELVSNFTAPINAQMKVGSLEQSITVTGESPLVDVQRTTTQHVLTRAVIDALPTGRNRWSVGMTLPAITSRVGNTAATDVGGLGGGQESVLVMHGSNWTDSRTQIDGMTASYYWNTALYLNDYVFQEMTYQSGGPAESETSGVVANLIPKDGGNTVSGSGLLAYSGSSFYTSNYSDELRQRGLLTPPGLNALWDYGLTVGGPISKSRLWYFGAARYWGNDRVVPVAFSLPWVPPEAPGSYRNELRSYYGRLTGQITPKNKVSVFYNHLPRIQSGAINRPGSENIAFAPSGTSFTEYLFPMLVQAKWTSTISSRMLLEVGYLANHLHTQSQNQDFVPADAVKKFDTVHRVQWNAFGGGSDGYLHTEAATVKFSYITGSHSFKAGIDDLWGYTGSDKRWVTGGDLEQQYQNGVPFQVIVHNTPLGRVRNHLDVKLGVFVQEAWTIDRLTVTGGLRFDYLRGSIPEQTAPAGTFVPARTFAAVEDLPTWTNWLPRLGLAYDLFGTGRTALKFSYGQYGDQVGVPEIAARYNPLAGQTDSRTWIDRNGDDRAQLDEIGPSTNRAFGLAAGATRPHANLERGKNTLYSVGAQHQLSRRMSVSAGYYRREYSHLRWTDNLLTTHDDYAVITVPDPRGNGLTIPIYNLSPTKRGQVLSVDRTSGANRAVYNGFDVSVTTRFAEGGSLTTGVSSGLTRERRCEVDDPNALRFCDQRDFDIPFDTTFKLAGSYVLPWGISAAAVFQSVPGLPQTITWVVGRAQVPTLTLPSVIVPLTAAGEAYLPRLNQLDVRFGKTVRYGRLRLEPYVGIFNVTNTATVLGRNNSFGPTLDRVFGIVDGRLVQLSLQIDF
jgi:carboxypeptidase family protein